MVAGTAGALEGSSTDADMLRFVDEILGQAEAQRGTGAAAEVMPVEAVQEEAGVSSTGAAGGTAQAAGERCASRHGSPQPGQPPRSAAVGPASTPHSKVGGDHLRACCHAVGICF